MISFIIVLLLIIIALPLILIHINREDDKENKQYVWYGNEYITQAEATKRKYEARKQDVLEMRNFCRDCKHWSNCRKAISMNKFHLIWCKYLL